MLVYAESKRRPFNRVAIVTLPKHTPFQYTQRGAQNDGSPQQHPCWIALWSKYPATHTQAKDCSLTNKPHQFFRSMVTVPAALVRNWQTCQIWGPGIGAVYNCFIPVPTSSFATLRQIKQVSATAMPCLLPYWLRKGTRLELFQRQ